MTEPMTKHRLDQIGWTEWSEKTPQETAEIVLELINEIKRQQAMLTDREDGIRMLIALENAGVDNWGGYSDAMASLRADR